MLKKALTGCKILKKKLFKRLKNLDEYYELLGCNEKYPVNDVTCEICDSHSFETICEYTDTGNNILTPVTVKACSKCGFIMQNPRFPDEFYARYYDEFYPYMRARSQSNVEGDPNTVGGQRQMDSDGTPNDFGFDIAVQRAKNLFKYIEKENIKICKKSLLDVGCGCGGFLHYFSERGYQVVGNDPDLKAVEFGIKKGLKIDAISGEKMEYSQKFGLIIIIGSLEHCLNPNIVLEKCWNMLEENGVIIIEGRYFPISESFRWLNSNHHRFFTHESSQSIFIKHGFSIIKSTTEPVCGDQTGRNGGGFAFGKKLCSNKRYLDTKDKKTQMELLEKLEEKELILKPEMILRNIKKHDEKFNIQYL